MIEYNKDKLEFLIEMIEEYSKYKDVQMDLVISLNRSNINCPMSFEIIQQTDNYEYAKQFISIDTCANEMEFLLREKYDM